MRWTPGQYPLTTETTRHSRKAGGTVQGAVATCPLVRQSQRAPSNSGLRERPDQVAGRYRSLYRTGHPRDLPRSKLMITSFIQLVLILNLAIGCEAGRDHRAIPAKGPVRSMPTRQQIDAEVTRMMTATGSKGIAIAVVDEGRVIHVLTYGSRNAAGDRLEPESIMYGASLTKSTFAYFVMQLVDEGVVDLDKSIAQYLPQPLPEYRGADLENRYARWSDLANDERWKKLTPRILLTHASGFSNFGFLEPDGKLRFHFDPGSRYSYSGDGIILLQFVLEKGLGLNVGEEMQKRIFAPFGMKDTSLIWRDDFGGRTADGWTIDGKVVPHDDRSKVRAAGSMDTTIADAARLAAGIVRGDRLSARARKEFSGAQRPIRTSSQFPTLAKDAPRNQQVPGLAAGLGVIVFDGPQGSGFFKGGHNDSTGNMLVCLNSSQRCAVVLGNDLRAEAAIPYLIDFILGEAGVPWKWEYGKMPLYEAKKIRN